MSVQIANVNPAIMSFQNWVDKTNQALYVISTQAVTTSLTTEGSTTAGNATVNGYFSANVLAVSESLRGGTITTSGNLNIISNTTVRDSAFYADNTSIRVVNSNTYINATAFRVVGGSANISSNVSITGSTTTLTSTNVVITTDSTRFTVGSANTIIAGSNTSVTANLIVGGTNTTFSSNVFFTGGVNFDGGLTVVGTTTLRGDVVLGNTAANTISVVGAVNTAIIPDQDLRRDLGSTTKRWSNLHVGTINAVRVEYQGDLIGVNTIGTNTITIGQYSTYVTYSNSNIGSANTAGVFTPVPVLTIDAADGRTIKAIIQMRNANINTYSSSELLIVHDETTPHMTVYATLSTNTSAPAYVYTTDISGGNVRVLAQQPAGSGNSSVIAQATYIGTL